MGLAIVAFSVVLKLVLYPLTKTSLKNAKLQSELKPNIDKLKKKYKDDKQGFMKAQAELFKQKGFNPWAGCLPQLAQLVVLYAFFGVFNHALTAGSMAESLNTLLYEPLKFQAGEAVNTAFLYLDITKPDIFNLGLPFPIPGPLLILAAITQFVSVKIMAPAIASSEKIAKKTPGETDDMQVAMTKYSTIMLPAMTLLFGIQFPSGLALYWFIFSLMQTLQQYRMSGWGGMTPWLKRLGLLQ